MRRALYSAAAIAALCGLSAVPAVAQTTATTDNTNARVTDGWRMPYQANFWSYIGACVDRSDYDLNGFSGYNGDQKDTGFKVFAGGKLYNALGPELAYVNLGRADVAGGTARAQGANASLVLGLPIMGDRFGITSLIGAQL